MFCIREKPYQNIFINYGTNNVEKVPIMKTWPGIEGLNFIHTLTNLFISSQRHSKECKTFGLYGILTEQFRPQHNEIILSLQYRKLSRQAAETKKDWMGRLRKMALDCQCKETDMYLKEQFINGINDDVVITEMIRKLMAINDTSSMSSRQV